MSQDARKALADLRARRRAARSGPSRATAGEQVVRLASNLIVTRLLLAEYFGLMALVSVFLIGLQLFSDIGIGPALVQNKREDPGFVNTVWTIQVFRGLALCAIAFPLGSLFAEFYDEPILTPLIRVSALTAAIRGFTSTSFYTQTRHLRLKGPVVVQFVAQLTGTIVMVGWAWVTRSVWSLVTSGIVAALVMVVLSHVWLPGIRNRFHFERRAARSLFVFGSWIFLSTVATFAANQVDRLIFGKLTTMSMLGVYSIAVMLALAPTQALSTVSNRVLFPLYTRVHYSHRRSAQHVPDGPLASAGLGRMGCRRLDRRRSHDHPASVRLAILGGGMDDPDRCRWFLVRYRSRRHLCSGRTRCGPQRLDGFDVFFEGLGDGRVHSAWLLARRLSRRRGRLGDVRVHPVLRRRVWGRGTGVR